MGVWENPKDILKIKNVSSKKDEILSFMTTRMDLY